MDPSYEELKTDAKIRQASEKEREISNKSYASIIVQRIVFWTIATLATGTIAFALKVLFDLVTKKYLR